MIKGVLQAIAAELRVLKGANFDSLQKSLNDRHKSREVLREKMLRGNNMPPKLLPLAIIPGRLTWLCYNRDERPD
jgi:hypothetical protein